MYKSYFIHRTETVTRIYFAIVVWPSLPIIGFVVQGYQMLYNSLLGWNLTQLLIHVCFITDD